MLEELIAGNKKIILVIIAGLVAVVLLAIAIIGWYNYYKYIAQTDFQPTGAPSLEIQKQEIIEGQLSEIDKLRKEFSTSAQPLSETELNKQFNSIDAYRKKTSAKPLTQEEIQKQLEELDKFKQLQ
ncbi:MAG: hypothetical protein AAB596_01860 [Patescibacteria group bacterium]